MEVFQFTLNTSLLNCFLSDTCRCWGWRWWCWLIPHSPHGTGSGSIPALQEGKWYNVVDAVSAFPLCLPRPYLPGPSASIRAYVMWVFCVEIFLPLRCTVFRYLSSTYLDDDDDDDDAPTEKTAAKICHVDLFLLNCGCWVYTRVNSFMVWISRNEGIINGVLLMLSFNEPLINFYVFIFNSTTIWQTNCVILKCL